MVTRSFLVLVISGGQCVVVWPVWRQRQLVWKVQVFHATLQEGVCDPFAAQPANSRHLYWAFHLYLHAQKKKKIIKVSERILRRHCLHILMDWEDGWSVVWQRSTSSLVTSHWKGILPLNPLCIWKVQWKMSVKYEIFLNRCLVRVTLVGHGVLTRASSRPSKTKWII